MFKFYNQLSKKKQFERLLFIGCISLIFIFISLLKGASTLFQLILLGILFILNIFFILRKLNQLKKEE